MDRLRTPHEVAVEILGISVRSLSRLEKAKLITAVVIRIPNSKHRVLRYRESDVKDFIARNLKEAAK